LEVGFARREEFRLSRGQPGDRSAGAGRPAAHARVAGGRRGARGHGARGPGHLGPEHGGDAQQQEGDEGKDERDLSGFHAGPPVWQPEENERHACLYRTRVTALSAGASKIRQRDGAASRVGGGIVRTPTEVRARDMRPLALTLLGGFQARLATGQVLTLPTRKTQALLAYLALRPGHPYTRDRLATLLWGDTGDEQARKSLRQAMYVLRKTLPSTEPPSFLVEGQTIALYPPAVEVDAAL